jgi:hypothetical protein
VCLLLHANYRGYVIVVITRDIRDAPFVQIPVSRIPPVLQDLRHLTLPSSPDHSARRCSLLKSKWDYLSLSLRVRRIQILLFIIHDRMFIPQNLLVFLSNFLLPFKSIMRYPPLPTR